VLALCKLDYGPRLVLKLDSLSEGGFGVGKEAGLAKEIARI
jgi:hypothetical protein